MAFIGNQPVEQYSSIAKQDITGNGGTTYTLNATVTSPEDIEVFINHVRQEPSTSYSVSGTTLTLTEALLSTDDCYVVYQGRTVGTKAPGDNTVGTGKIQANAVTAAKLATSLDFQNITIKGGSNNAMTIDSTGRVFRPVIPHIFATRRNNSGGGYLTISNGAKFEFDTIIESGGGMTLSSGGVSIPVTGLYFFNISMLNNNVENNELSVKIGTGNYFRRCFVNDHRYMNVSFTKTFTASDVINVHNTGGGNRGWHYAGPESDQDIYSTISGYLIG